MRFEASHKVGVIAIVALVGLLGACTNPINTGQVSGTVTVGPMCPASSCPDQPAAGIAVAFLDSAPPHSEMARGTTNRAGHYSVTLPPGDYAVHLYGRNPINPDIGTLGAIGPSSVRVEQWHTTQADYHLFSGIL